jgi:integrase
MNKHRVKLVRFTNGERFPVLVNDMGIPLFLPTLFAVTELRMRNLASNTISNVLRSLQVFVLFLEREHVDLTERFSAGEVLKMHELEALVQACRRPLEVIVEVNGAGAVRDSTRLKMRHLEDARNRMRSDAPKIVNAAVTASRLQSIRDYVRWQAEMHLDRPGTSLHVRGQLRAAVDTFARALEARMPVGGASVEREGLAVDHRNRLREVTRPESLENPWAEVRARHRNALMIDWLYDLGLRRGELLSVRCSDVDFRRGVVTILRRPDDLDDPRRNQPVVKTRGRELPLSAENIDATRHYVINIRGSLPGARKHQYLFVATDTGAPLSMPALAKIFRVLRSKVIDLPADLSPHVLRHTWNDRFSEEMDRKNVSEDTEKKARAYLMGWSETSSTASTYTRRHVREQAKKVSLELQERMLIKKDGQ